MILVRLQSIRKHEEFGEVRPAMIHPTTTVHVDCTMDAG